MKCVDRYFGILLIFILGLFSKKRTQPAKIESFGLLKSAALGDTILLSAVLQDLKYKFPDAKLFFFSGNDNAVLLPHLPCVDKAIALSIKNPMQAIRLIRKNPVDVFLDFGAWPRINSLLTFFSKSKWRVGFKTRGEGRHFIYDRYVLHNKDIHELDNYRNLVSWLGIEKQHLPKLLFCNSHSDGKYVVFHLGSSAHNWREKIWPICHWQELFSYFQKRGFFVYLTGNNRDRSINTQLTGAIDLAGKISFDQTLSLLASAKVVISVNSGIMHAATAVNAPLISLSGLVNITRWGALGKKVINLKPPFGDPNSYYIDKILPTSVITAFEEMSFMH